MPSDCCINAISHSPCDLALYQHSYDSAIGTAYIERITAMLMFNMLNDTVDTQNTIKIDLKTFKMAAANGFDPLVEQKLASLAELWWV